MNVLIAGKGKSGKAAEKLLKHKGFNVEFVDDGILNADKQKLEKTDLDRLFDGLSFIVSSPGIDPKLPFFKVARKQKIKIVGELELGASFCDANIIAVTGTNGKTTTVSLIYHLLAGCKNSVFLGGNIGVPVCSFANKTNKNDVVVLECSSFQLETINRFHPHIACLLNLSEDHLVRHKTMKKYLKCKLNIAKNLTSNDYLLVNADDEILMSNLPKTSAKVFMFSTKKQVVGCYKQNNSIYFNDNQKKIKLLSLKNIKLVGEHNISNILCACLAVFLQTKNKELLARVYTFSGVEHRIEYVKTINHVSFFNDSKATNINSTLVALKSFKCGINLILGGSDKGFEFDELFKFLPKNVKNIAVFGQTKNKIISAASKFGFCKIKVFDSLKASTIWCFNRAKANEIVLLSPACASFDCFVNYEERGSIFKKIVGEIFENETACTQTSTKT